MIDSYFKFIVKGALVSTLCLINHSYAASSTTQPNSMPSCAAYREMVTCNASKANKGKGSQCMFLFPNNDRPAGERSGAVTCQAISDTETVNFFKRINIKEIVDLYPDLYEYDESSNIGNANHPNFHNNKRHTMVGGFVQGNMVSTINLKKYHELCVAKNDEETCNRAIFERNKDFMIRDVQNEDTSWGDKDTESVEWDKIPETARLELMSAELERKEREVTKILLQIKATTKAARQAAGKAAGEERKLKIKAALEKEKEDGADARFDEQCKSNTSGKDCRQASLRHSGLLSGVNCVWTHKDGMMGGGTCRYANTITCEDLKSKDCAADSETLKEINNKLSSAGITFECNWSNRTCSTAAG